MVHLSVFAIILQVRNAISAVILVQYCTVNVGNGKRVVAIEIVALSDLEN